ncbi:MAG: DUF4335 domain-containing protein [Prochlorotrichaceae cyanobacterium]
MPQLIQYLCPSWRLSLYGRPSALSRWSDRPVLQYDRAQLLRLNSEEDPKESLVWEGSAQELQDLQDILQNYIQDLLQRSHQAFLAGEQSQGLDSQGLEAQPPREGTSAAFSTGDRNSQADARKGKGLSVTNDPHQAAEADKLPVMRVEAVGAMAHSLFLPPDTTLSLSTLECFDLAEVLDQWQAETLSLPTLPKAAPKTPPAWLRTAALILITVGASSSVSLLGLQWWQQQQLQVAQSETAPSQANTPELTLDELSALPNLHGSSDYTPIPRLPSEVYGPPAPGQPDVSLGIELQGVGALPSGDFAGLPMPPPPDFSALPPPPPGYNAPATGEPYQTYAPDPYYVEPSRSYDNADDYGGNNSSSDYAALPAPSISSRSAPAQGLAPAAPLAVQPETVAPPAAESDNASRLGDIAGYFQGRWQPPGNLNGSLEYQLLIGSDGTLQAISPLSDRAGNFIDRTGIPLLGEPITSPGPELLVTIVFYAEGGVDVF